MGYYDEPSIPGPLGDHVALTIELVRAIFGGRLPNGVPADVSHFEAIRAEAPLPACLIQGVKDGEWVGPSFSLSAKQDEKTIEFVVADDDKDGYSMACQVSHKGRAVSIVGTDGRSRAYLGMNPETLASKHENMAELAKMDREIMEWSKTPEAEAVRQRLAHERLLTPEKLAAGIEVLTNGTLVGPPAEQDKDGNWWFRASTQADIDVLEKAVGRRINVYFSMEPHSDHYWAIEHEDDDHDLLLGHETKVV